MCIIRHSRICIGDSVAASLAESPPLCRTCVLVCVCACEWRTQHMWTVVAVISLIQFYVYCVCVCACWRRQYVDYTTRCQANEKEENRMDFSAFYTVWYTCMSRNVRVRAHIEYVNTFYQRLLHEQDPFDMSLSLICIKQANLWIFVFRTKYGLAADVQFISKSLYLAQCRACFILFGAQNRNSEVWINDRLFTISMISTLVSVLMFILNEIRQTEFHGPSRREMGGQSQLIKCWRFEKTQQRPQ